MKEKITPTRDQKEQTSRINNSPVAPETWKNKRSGSYEKPAPLNVYARRSLQTGKLPCCGWAISSSTSISRGPMFLIMPLWNQNWNDTFFGTPPIATSLCRTVLSTPAQEAAASTTPAQWERKADGARNIGNQNTDDGALSSNRKSPS